MAVRTFSIFVIFVVFTTVGANYGCTKRGGKCSDSYDCPSTGGEQEKLRVKCHRAKACCMCSDTCLEGSYCIASDSLCDDGFGTVDPTGCCGDKVCCTPSEDPLCSDTKWLSCKESCNMYETQVSMKCQEGKMCCM